MINNGEIIFERLSLEMGNGHVIPNYHHIQVFGNAFDYFNSYFDDVLMRPVNDKLYFIKYENIE